MTMDIFSRLMQDVGAALHLGELTLEGGRCLIGVDEVVLHVDYLEATEQVLLYGEVAPLPPATLGSRESLYAALLEGQCFFQQTCGATLAVSAELQSILLQTVQPLCVLDVNSFMKLLENFFTVMQHWQEVCAAKSREVTPTAQGRGAFPQGAMLRG